MGYAIKEYINNHPYGHIISWRRFLLTLEENFVRFLVLRGNQ